MDVKTVGADAAAAVQASQMAPGQVATLILPSDTSWNDGGIVAERLPLLAAPTAEPKQVIDAASILRQNRDGVVLLIGAGAVCEEGLELAHRIAVATGCAVMSDSSRRVPRGQGRFVPGAVPYVVDMAVKAMAGTKHLILCGSRKPVTFFAYPGRPSSAIPDSTEITVLARREQDVLEALRRLADELKVPKIAAPDNGPRPDKGGGLLTPENFAATVGALMPENAVMANEAITYGRAIGPSDEGLPTA